MKEIIAVRGTGEQQIQLQRRWLDGTWHYELIANGVFIMASYNALSSQLLVEFPCRSLGLGARPCRVLVGGLGLGYTVRQACRQPNVTAVELVEINPHIIELNRRELAEENGHCLKDPRVRVQQADFFDYVDACRESFDLICMDIDNGPMQLLRQDNQRVYLPSFYQRIRELLRPGGVFIVWSCNPSPQLQADLAAAFGSCGQEIVSERVNGQDLPYYLYYAPGERTDAGI